MLLQTILTTLLFAKLEFLRRKRVMKIQESDPESTILIFYFIHGLSVFYPPILWLELWTFLDPLRGVPEVRRRLKVSESRDIRDFEKTR